MKNPTDRWRQGHRLQEYVRGEAQPYESGERTKVVSTSNQGRKPAKRATEPGQAQDVNWSTLCGGAMVLWGLFRGNLGGIMHAAVGGLLIHRGLNHRCPLCGAHDVVDLPTTSPSKKPAHPRER